MWALEERGVKGGFDATLGRLLIARAGFRAAGLQESDIDLASAGFLDAWPPDDRDAGYWSTRIDASEGPLDARKGFIDADSLD